MQVKELIMTDWSSRATGLIGRGENADNASMSGKYVAGCVSLNTMVNGFVGSTVKPATDVFLT